MENLFLLLATGLVWRMATPKFKRYLIGRTGCTALLLSDENSLHVQSTKDGERVYYYEHEAGGATYGMIVVNMKELYALEQAENILVQYVNRIRKPLGISYNVSMEMETTGAEVTLTDYWQDDKGLDWKIRGCSNGKVIAVLYTKNIGDSAVKEHDAFLNGFRFSPAL